LAPTPEPRPTREPPPSPTAKPPPAPVSPVEDFRKGIPESPDTPGGGLALVGWLHQELALHDVEEPSRDFRKEINASFAKRNEEIFEASQWKGTAGGFSRTYHAKSLETLRSVEDLEKIPEVVSQAYFFSLLAFYMDGKEYLLLSKQFEDLVPSLISALEKTPALARSAPGKVIRVIGEDLRDSDSEKLSVLGLNLLEALAKSK
jgi:hypothetical protein